MEGEFFFFFKPQRLSFSVLFFRRVEPESLAIQGIAAPCECLVVLCNLLFII